MQQHKQEVVAFDDVNDEIFDMVRPADPSKISLQDLVNWYYLVTLIAECSTIIALSFCALPFISGYGDTVVNILIDLDGFWTYENRETVVTDRSNSERQESG